MNFIQIFLLLNLVSNTYAYPKYLKCDGTFVKGQSKGMDLMKARTVMGEIPVDDTSMLSASSVEVGPGSSITLTLESPGRGVIQASGGSLYMHSKVEGTDVNGKDDDGDKCTGTNQIIYFYADSSVEPSIGQFSIEWTAPSSEGTEEIVAATASNFGVIHRTSISITIKDHFSEDNRTQSELSYLTLDTNQSKTTMYYLSFAALGVLACLVCIWRRGRKGSSDDVEMDGNMRTKIRHESGI